MAPPTGTASAFSRCHPAGNESLVGEAPAHARPWATSPLLADPRLVHEPDLDILSRLLGPHRVDLRSEVFFNRYALTVRPIADSLRSITRFGPRRAVETSEVAFGRDPGDRKQNEKGFHNLTQARREQARLQRSGAQAVRTRQRNYPSPCASTVRYKAANFSRESMHRLRLRRAHRGGLGRTKEARAKSQPTRPYAEELPRSIPAAMR